MWEVLVKALMVYEGVLYGTQQRAETPSGELSSTHKHSFVEYEGVQYGIQQHTKTSPDGV